MTNVIWQSELRESTFHGWAWSYLEGEICADGDFHIATKFSPARKNIFNQRETGFAVARFGARWLIANKQSFANWNWLRRIARWWSMCRKLFGGKFLSKWIVVFLPFFREILFSDVRRTAMTMICGRLYYRNKLILKTWWKSKQNPTIHSYTGAVSWFPE